jgi:formylglycine-generating enzyme required for sulfatase activity
MTHPVGQKQANGYGLFDLSGNVWEWTNDDYDNPGVYRSGAGGRVIRGGGWRYGADYCELSRRHWYSPDYRVSLGLRFSRSL